MGSDGHEDGIEEVDLGCGLRRVCVCVCAGVWVERGMCVWVERGMCVLCVCVCVCARVF